MTPPTEEQLAGLMRYLKAHADDREPDGSRAAEQLVYLAKIADEARALGWDPSLDEPAPLGHDAAMRVADAAAYEGAAQHSQLALGVVYVQKCEEAVDKLDLAKLVSRILGPESEVQRAERRVVDAVMEREEDGEYETPSAGEMGRAAKSLRAAREKAGR